MQSRSRSRYCGALSHGNASPHLLRRPLRSWMCRDREMNDASPIVCQYQKHVQYLEPDRWHSEEVDGHHAFPVVFKEGTPGLGCRLPASNHVLTYAGFSNVDQIGRAHV